jgi:lipopolysaccharide/colanic/teichoic acid biosynthesis glycosyltransferase
MNTPPPISPLAVSVPAPRRDGWHALGFLARIRYQLLGAIIFAVVLPTLIHREVNLATWRWHDGSAETTLIGTFLAVLMGALVLRQMVTYPGVQRFSPILPAFFMTFGAVLAVFLFLRLDYSRLQLLGGFLASISWFYFVMSIERHARRPLLLVVSGGDAASLLANDQVDTKLARMPDQIPAGITAVVADLRADHSDAWERFLAHCALNGIPVYHWKQVSESLTGRVAIEHLSENNLGSLVPPTAYMQFKRATDITLAIIALPVAAVVALAIALAIKLEDGGPVLFRQTRMGFRGRNFTMLKFRTMKVGVGANIRPYTEESDPRITRVGRLLRRFRIDELPQLINILKGQMSWIGPRPESLELARWYESRIPFYSYRHIVRPGISGWAQVNQGNVAEVEAATTKLHYDFYYIKYFSPWLELLILGKTVRTVLTGFGAR